MIHKALSHFVTFVSSFINTFRIKINKITIYKKRKRKIVSIGKKIAYKGYITL